MTGIAAILRYSMPEEDDEGITEDTKYKEDEEEDEKKENLVFTVMRG